MFYHASQVANIEVLEPKISNHNIPLIYFSDKKENVLVYLSNAVEKYCKDNHFSYEGNWKKWASYGFNREGKLQLEEYYPNALEETYKGISGFIYHIPNLKNEASFEIKIPNAFALNQPIKVIGCEIVVDAYEEILNAERLGLIEVIRYDEFILSKKNWLIKTIKEQYDASENQPDYRFFLENKFDWILK